MSKSKQNSSSAQLEELEEELQFDDHDSYGKGVKEKQDRKLVVSNFLETKE